MANTRIDAQTLHILEFQTVLHQVSDHARSETGKARIASLLPLPDPDQLKKELAVVTEARDCLRFDDPFPPYHFPDMRPFFPKIRVIGGALDPAELLAIGRFLQSIRQIRQYFTSRPDKYFLLQVLVQRLVPLPDIEKSISHAVGPDGEIRDDASHALKKIRREMAEIADSVRKRLEHIMQDLSSRGMTQESQLTIRNGRLVVPVKDSCRGQLQGIVVDHSASGATVFMEPLEIIEKNNDISRLKNREQQEIAAILSGLTSEIREFLPALEESEQSAGILDSILARARYSIEIRGVPAAVGQDGRLELEDGRHPILMMRLKGEEVIPLSIRLGDPVQTIVITGPNAGGKTVALKTVGLLALMHLHGMHIPAGENSVFPLFSGLYADIGDRQSIEKDLSTFSSHMQNILNILKQADHRSLVLLDEIGSSTDPAEGSALAEAVLRHLTDMQCLTVATTHMGSLKVFAHEEKGVENGSMAFDHDTLKPTYRFQMGIPGSSYAFEIAGRLGLPASLIESARTKLGEERGKLDRLIIQLEADLEKARKLLGEAEIKESKWAGLAKLYRDKLDLLEREGEERKKKILDEAETVLKESNAMLERMVREIRETQAKKESIRKTKSELAAQKKKIQTVRQKKKTEQPSHVLRAGDWVAWKGHRGLGNVISGRDKTGRVLVSWEGVKMKLPLESLSPAAPPEEKSHGDGFTVFSGNGVVKNEIDLRGMISDEAVEAVDKYLGEAATAGFQQVRIIHGKGMGVLRREISRFLKGHPLVKQQRLGQWNEGDTGVTVVELR